ncbi:hypothetical protein STXM2123_1144 [Streptomyces sp. F-3]|nr:hypothetical protein STXM2123_1144 [Streptomyces sp. F-3]
MSTELFPGGVDVPSAKKSQRGFRVTPHAEPRAQSVKNGHEQMLRERKLS